MSSEAVLGREEAITTIATCFGQGDLAQAEHIALKLFEANNGDEEALHLLAQLAFQRGNFMQAVERMEKLIGMSPMRAAYYNDYGVMLAATGRWHDAEAAHRLSLTMDAANLDARFNLALMLFRQHRTADALAVLDELHGMAPTFAEPYALRGEVLRAEKRHIEAVSALSQAVELGLQTPEVMAHLGMALSDAGHQDEAFDVLVKTGEINPDDAAVSFYMGNIAKDKGEFAEAAGYFRKSTEQNPNFAEANNNLGLVLQELGDMAGAEAAFNAALFASPQLGAAHNNLGNWQIKQGRMEAALACFEKAVEMSPDLPEAWNNLGEAYYRLQRLSEAESAYRKALAIKPDCLEAELNLGILLLLRGDYEEGWQRFEARWEMPAIKAKRQRFKEPEWAGEPLDGKTLLIYVEQGMGDNLQFVRYLRVLRDRYPNARIYYWGLRPLFRLFAEYAASCGVELLPETIPGGVPPIDYHVALMSVPRLLGTTVATIPEDVPYLAPPSALVAKWGARLAGLRGKKVGLVWASGETYLFHMFRTMRLRQFFPLLDVAGVSWVSLQKGNATGQIAEEGLSGRIVNLMDGAEDFADTAAIIANLDLVISVDTSVPHLAGAMGKPVWLLDRFDTDWRWMLNREDSPWYPTMRIFRQTSFANWDSVIPRAAEALREWVGKIDTSEKDIPMETVQLGQDVCKPALKLNLGCGSRKMDGFVNVDCVAICEPDMVVNLEQTPWPWEDNSVDEIKLIHVLEHLGQSTDVFLAIIKEIYRVCRDGARIEIIVPHPRSDHYLGDPTHVRPVTLPMLNLFSQRLNREWAAMGAANTPLGMILDVDFEVESAQHDLEQDWLEKLSSGQVSEADLHQAMRQFNNVVVQTRIVWRVNKGG